MNNDTLYLEAASALELKGKLEAMPKGSKLENKFVVMSVSGNQAIVRNFELPILAAKK